VNWAKGVSDGETRLRHVVEATPNAMVMVDCSGLIVLVNRETEKLFGYTRDELLSMTVEDLIPDRFKARHHGFRSEFFANPDTRTMGAGRDLYGLRKDGSEMPIEIGLNPLDTEDGSYVLASVIDITERKRSDERMLQMVEAAPNAMLMVNEEGRIVLVNSQAERSFGYDRDELFTMYVEDLIPERYRPHHGSFRASFFAQPDRRDMGVGRELFGRRKDGTEVPIEIGLNPIQIMDENFVLASIIDISERLVVQAAANSAREDLQRKSILDSLPFSVVVTNTTGTILTVNPAAERMLGYRQDELVGADFGSIHSDQGRRPDQFEAARETVTRDGDRERECLYRCKDGSTIPVNEVTTPMSGPDGDTGAYLNVGYDITKRVEAQAFVQHLAQHDALTDLPNRTRLFEHLASVIQPDPGPDSAEVVVLLLDLDHFKRVNDSLGHPVGDELLLRMASRLQESVRPEDLVSRLGGDEFVIVLSDVTSARSLNERVEELMEAVAAPMRVHGHELIVTASVGGAVFPRDGLDPETLIKNADTAMYHAKVAGRNVFQWFFNSMLDEMKDKVVLSAALRHALEAGEFSLAYQPLVSVASGEVMGMEALCRWDSPTHGTISPERFIPVAEDSGMITELGEWVLRTACSEAAQMQSQLGRPLKLAVNASPRQFRSSNWLTVVDRALEGSAFDPALLELEITEGILMEGPRDVIDVLHTLRGKGIGIVVDDFGTGFSSLAYLTRFPIDKIKIDRSFVRDLVGDDADAAIVDTIIVMAHTLGMKVVAEGVETQEQLSYLEGRGCDQAQGYLFSKAVPAAEFVTVVQTLGAVVRPG